MIARALAFQLDGAGEPDAAEATRVVAAELPGWTVERGAVAHWYTATPPAPVGLGRAWEHVRNLKRTRHITQAEPLLLVTNLAPQSEQDANTFALGAGQSRFGLWGLPYDAATAARIKEQGAKPDWHLDQLMVPAAWDAWRLKFPGREPGDGILVGHPDTGFSDHTALVGHFDTPGRSFLVDQQGQPETDARDALRVIGGTLIETPGHGTATASIIVGQPINALVAFPGQVAGVAPGAHVLPLRVSRSVLHFDFGNVAGAVRECITRNVDVVSMSLGGPGYSEYLRQTIRDAQQRGIIVIAAAGNQTPATVFPAALPEVIGVAATHAAEGPWRFTGIGRLVDIAAPGDGVNHATAITDEHMNPTFAFGRSSGTSFATACVAGLASLWLAYRGGRQQIADAQYSGQLGLVPYAFQWLLAATARKQFDFVREGRYGAGIPHAADLLQADLPQPEEVERFRAVIQHQPVHWLTFVSGLFSGGMGIDDASTVSLTIDGARDTGTQPTDTAAVKRATSDAHAEQALVARLLANQADELAPELLARVGADRMLLVAFQRIRQGESVLPLIDLLLSSGGDLSTALRTELEAGKQREVARLQTVHRGRLRPPAPRPIIGGALLTRQPPPNRRLRAYAFDPSLATRLDTAPITQITIPVRWEDVQPGPIGEYLEVVDVDPASGCVYEPVDLDHPHVLAQNGVAPSEGDPQFHQQMVYGVAMNTIHHFELALGRPVFWSPLRPSLADRPAERYLFTREAYDPPSGTPDEDRYVQRLRIYPHALREQNAYYSPNKIALLFGYFNATEDDSGDHLPGGMVFTCLSHDIVAHETTHAILDGMHRRFLNATNPDVHAFHEAFADIVALFQHFTFPEILRRQIASTRGEIRAHENLLGQLAGEFGRSTGLRGSLRDAIGKINDEGVWEPHKADPNEYQETTEPHDRGAILVAAVFDAFLSIYERRISDLLRLATGGTGILQPGAIHPDLVNRLSEEAAKAAQHVLTMCIRALDYCPPVDITFGEYLRAIITADFDLVSDDDLNYRIAFIEAFRKRGIHPRDVRTLSVESLLWRGPLNDEGDPSEKLEKGLDLLRAYAQRFLFEECVEEVIKTEESLEKEIKPRKELFELQRQVRKELHDWLKDHFASQPEGKKDAAFLGLDTSLRFEVHSARFAFRISPDGDMVPQIIVGILQRKTTPVDPDDPNGDQMTFEGGSTIVADLRRRKIRYCIRKNLGSTGRLARQQEFAMAALDSVRATYLGFDPLVRGAEPFALLHRGM